MRQTILLLLGCCSFLLLAAQGKDALIAQKEQRTKRFEIGESIKLKWSDGQTSSNYRGPLLAVTDSTVVLGRFSRSDKRHVDIPLRNIVKVKRIRRGARALSAGIFVAALIPGALLIADANSTQQSNFSGNGTVVGGALIGAGLFTYVVGTMTEKSASKHRGYTFITKNSP
jgi:hypothetical protein